MEVKKVAYRDSVRCIKVSPDGKRVLVCSDLGDVYIYTTDGRIVGKFPGHDGQVWGGAWDPSGKYFATGSHDTLVRLYDVERQKIIAEGTCESTVFSVAFYRDKIIAATGSELILLKREGQNLVIEKIIDYPAVLVEVRPQTFEVIGATNSGYVGVYEKEFKKKREFRAHNGNPTSIAIHKTEPWVASTGFDGRVVLTEYKKKKVHELYRAEDAITTAVMFLDDEVIASTDNGRIFGVRRGSKVLRPIFRMRGEIYSFAFIKEQGILIIGSDENLLFVKR